MARGGTTWPTMTDYQEAVQNPKQCFQDPLLQNGLPVMNKLGLPRPICGQFASVYELENGGERWAIKCFLRNIPDLHNRYAKISNHLSKCTLPYFVAFDYIQKGIKVRGQFYPIVKMEWVEGLALNHFVERNLSSPASLEQLEERWLELLEDLQSVKVAHGDLQHGNVLVDSGGNLRLIDYDGMWVPKLKGQKSHETGHPDYQSPLRTEKDFNIDADGFAGTVIQVAFRALVRDPQMWGRYNNGDNILFRRRDFLDPKHSQLFAELKALGDDEISDHLTDIAKACGGKLKKAKPSRHFKPKQAAAPAAPPAGGGSGGAGGGGGGGAATAVPPPKPKPKMIKPAPPPPPPRPKPARQISPAPQPAAPASSVGWLSDHVSGGGAASSGGGSSAPAPTAAHPKPPRPSPVAARPASRDQYVPLGQRVLGYTRLLVHIFLVAPLVTGSSMELAGMLDGGDQATAIQMTALGLAGLLGLVSTVSVFTMRAIHATVSTLFFGFTVLLVLTFVFSELLTSGWSDWTGDDPFQCAMMLWMLLLAGVGPAVEYGCRRKGVITRWRMPWKH